MRVHPCIQFALNANFALTENILLFSKNAQKNTEIGLLVQVKCLRACVCLCGNYNECDGKKAICFLLVFSFRLHSQFSCFFYLLFALLVALFFSFLPVSARSIFQVKPQLLTYTTQPYYTALAYIIITKLSFQKSA